MHARAVGVVDRGNTGGDIHRFVDISQCTGANHLGAIGNTESLRGELGPHKGFSVGREDASVNGLETGIASRNLRFLEPTSKQKLGRNFCHPGGLPW